MLAREFPKHPATRETLLAARQDTSEEVRLRAAMALGDEGRDTLVDLVARVGTGDSCAARAIVALGEHLPEELAQATLRRALGGARRPQTAQACLEALGRPGRAAAEGLLLEALRGDDLPVSVAAAQALGRAGTVAAVAPLREAAERRGELRQRRPPGDRRDPVAPRRRRARPALARGRGGGRPLARGRRARPAQPRGAALSSRGASSGPCDEGSAGELAHPADPSGPGRRKPLRMTSPGSSRARRRPAASPAGPSGSSARGCGRSRGGRSRPRARPRPPPPRPPTGSAG